jgi:hypothetical protein
VTRRSTLTIDPKTQTVMEHGIDCRT